MTLPSVARVRNKLPIPDSTERWRRKKEHLHIQNRDTRASHDIDVVIRTDEAVVHRGEYHLLPDQSGCSVNVVPPGSYTVTATVDGTDRATATLRVSDCLDGTICIQVAESSVSIHQGLRR